MSGSDERYSINRKIVSETIDGEVIILNLDRGRYYSLNSSGAEAWTAFQSSATVTDVVEDLLTRYSADRSEVEPAVRQLVAELCREELLVPAQPVDLGNGASAAPAPEPRETGRNPFVAPVLHTYTDMQDLLLLDPIHEVDETGWPNLPPQPPASSA